MACMSGLCLCVLSLRVNPGADFIGGCGGGWDLVQARPGGGWRNAAGIRSVYFDFYCVLQCLLLKLVFVHHNVQIMLSLDLLQRG